MNTIRLSLVVGICILVGAFSCPDDSDCPNRFALPVRIVNPQIEYHLGDTIRVQSKFWRGDVGGIRTPTVAIHVDMGGVRWYPNTRVSRIDTLYQDNTHFHPSLVGSGFDFVENPNIPYYPSNSGTLKGEYTYVNDTFLLEYDLVAREVGTYLLLQFTTLDIDDAYQEYPWRCGTESISAEYAMNNEYGTYTGNNLSLLLESPNPYYSNTMYQDNKNMFYRQGGYCFRVVP
jgi:hypothetical protein